MTLPSDRDDLHLLLHAYADGEIEAPTALAVERRLAADAALAGEYERIRALKSAIAGRLAPTPTPDALRRRIAALVVNDPEALPPAAVTRRDWRQFAAGLILGVLIAGAASYSITRNGRDDALVENLVANHRRAMLAAAPVDVASSDRHTVRPWFETRFALAVPAINLADKGFPLVGGRVDMAGMLPTAALVFRAREHLISLTVIPGDDGLKSAGETLRRLSSNGFSAWRWRDGGRVYWAVSDVEPADLAAFVAAFRASNAAP